MQFTRLVHLASSAAIRLALFAIVPLAVVSVQAQSISATYRAAAQAARDAAAKTKSPRNRSCYLAQANYHDCLAAQLGPNGPRSCPPPSCSLESEPNTPATGGSTAAPVNPAPSTEDMNRTMQEILDRNARDREVEEEVRREREEASNLKPVEMTPGGNDLLKDLNAGADAASRLGLKDTKTSGESLDSGAFEDLSRGIQEDSDRPEAFGFSKGSTDFANHEKQILGEKIDDFYRAGDPLLSDLYTPGATGSPEGWGVPEFDPRSIDEFPTSIEFGPDGMSTVQYQDRFAIPKSIQFLEDGRSVIEYGPDANYAQGVTINFERGQVTSVQGPVDNRVPTVITYDNSGRVLSTQHGPRVQSGPTQNAGPQPQTNTNALPTSQKQQPPTNFLSDKSLKVQPPARKNETQTQETQPPGLIDRAKQSIRDMKERFNNAYQSGKRWLNETVATVQQCRKDLFECVTGLEKATK